MTRALLQPANCLLRTTPFCRQPARPNPGDLRIRSPLPSPLHPPHLLMLPLPQPSCHQPLHLMHASYGLDSALPSCTVLVLCLLNIPTVIDAPHLFYLVLPHSHIRSVLPAGARYCHMTLPAPPRPTHTVILFCCGHCQSLQMLYHPIPLYQLTLSRINQLKWYCCQYADD